MSQFARLFARAAVTVFAPLVFVLTAHARPTLNFDTFTGMGNSPGAFVPTTARLSNQFVSSGVVFRSGSGAAYVSVVDLSGTGTTSFPNAIGGATLANGLTYSGSPLIIANFVDPTNAATPFVTNFVSVRGDTFPSGGTIGLQAFNINNVLIGSVSQTDVGGNLLSITAAGINRVEIIGSTNSDVAYDDFTFNPVTAAVVPEGGTLALLGFALMPVGFGLARPHTGAVR